MSATVAAAATQDARPHCAECDAALTPTRGASVYVPEMRPYRHVEDALLGCSRYWRELRADRGEIVWRTDEEVQYRRWCSRVRLHLADLGRPFRKCVYCACHHLLPTTEAEKKEPRFRPCLEERFVTWVLWQFPILRRHEAPGVTPWKPETWAKWWRTSGAQTSGSYHAVAFVLSVWAGENTDYWKRRGYSFDIVRAWGSWDDAHRAACLHWLNHPWRP
jgi:hypothetical protein